jgi:hypothetical protein
MCVLMGSIVKRRQPTPYRVFLDTIVWQELLMPPSSLVLPARFQVRDNYKVLLNVPHVRQGHTVKPPDSLPRRATARPGFIALVALLFQILTTLVQVVGCAKKDGCVRVVLEAPFLMSQLATHAPRVIIVRKVHRRKCHVNRGTSRQVSVRQLADYVPNGHTAPARQSARCRVASSCTVRQGRLQESIARVVDTARTSRCYSPPTSVMCVRLVNIAREV